jgi:hypothetical protein
VRCIPETPPAPDVEVRALLFDGQARGTLFRHRQLQARGDVAEHGEIRDGIAFEHVTHRDRR